MFPTISDSEFVSIKSAVSKLAEAWLNGPNANRHPSGLDDADCDSRRAERMKALRLQLDVMKVQHVGAVKNLGQLQCVTRFLAQNIAIN